MSKVLGLSVLLVLVLIGTWSLSSGTDWSANLENLLGRTGRFGIMGIGAALVIVTGGIDLSIGSVVGLCGTLLPMLIVGEGWPAGVAIPVVLLLGALLGLIHGLLITRMGLQPFVVTLCGLLLYRGVARYIADDRSQGWGSSKLALRDTLNGAPLSLAYFLLLLGFGALLAGWLFQRTGNRNSGRLSFVAAAVAFGTSYFGLSDGGSFMATTRVPTAFLLLVGVSALAGLFLSHSVQGRHLLALGRNEEAARLSGVPTRRLTVLAYVVCAALAGLAGVLFAVKQSAVQPATAGSFYELYAIAAAVLGGCSLRGGEGTILGVVVGTALLRTLLNAINLLGFDQQLEFAIIGAVILLGVSTDEIVRRVVAHRKRRRAGRAYSSHHS